VGRKTLRIRDDTLVVGFDGSQPRSEFPGDHALRSRPETGLWKAMVQSGYGSRRKNVNVSHPIFASVCFFAILDWGKFILLERIGVAIFLLRK